MGPAISARGREFIGLGLVQGFGMGLAFAPMTAIAFSTLRADLRTEASGLYALVRNVSGAIGISIIVGVLAILSMLSVQGSSSDLAKQYLPQTLVTNEI